MPSDSAVDALASHAGERDTLRFSEVILHGPFRFAKGEVVRFSDPAAAAFFDVAFNGTEFTTDEPDRVLTDEEINFDPDDPRGNATIDPHTRIVGRDGVKDGSTVHQVVTGDAPAGAADSSVRVKDVTGSTKIEGP